jgi:hypothetical protein
VSEENLEQYQIMIHWIHTELKIFIKEKKMRKSINTFLGTPSGT